MIQEEGGRKGKERGGGDSVLYPNLLFRLECRITTQPIMKGKEGEEKKEKEKEDLIGGGGGGAHYNCHF